MTVENLIQEYAKQAEALFDAEIPLWLLKRKTRIKAELLRILREWNLSERPDVWRQEADFQQKNPDLVRRERLTALEIGTDELFRRLVPRSTNEAPVPCGDLDLCKWLAGELLALFPEKKEP